MDFRLFFPMVHDSLRSTRGPRSTRGGTCTESFFALYSPPLHGSPSLPDTTPRSTAGFQCSREAHVETPISPTRHAPTLVRVLSTFGHGKGSITPAFGVFVYFNKELSVLEGMHGLESQLLEIGSVGSCLCKPQALQSNDFCQG